MKLMDVPLEELHITGGMGRAIRMKAVQDTYAAFDAGKNGMDTLYAQKIPTRREWRVNKLREAHLGGIGPHTEPIKVLVQGNGRIEIRDGHHRTGAFLYHGRKTIPCEVVGVGALFQDLVDRLQRIYPDRPDTMYQSIEHPYFQGWSVDRSDERWSLILDYAAAHKVESTWIDVGSCTGKGCREAARRGWFTYGVDIDRGLLWISEYLDMILSERPTTYTRCEPHLWRQSMLCSGYRWGVVVCLSVFYRLLAAGDTAGAKSAYRHLMDRSSLCFLDNITQRHMDKINPACSVSMEPGAYRDWLQGLSSDHVVEILGETEGRTLYVSRRVR